MHDAYYKLPSASCNGPRQAIDAEQRTRSSAKTRPHPRVDYALYAKGGAYYRKSAPRNSWNAWFNVDRVHDRPPRSRVSPSTSPIPPSSVERYRGGHRRPSGTRRRRRAAHAHDQERLTAYENPPPTTTCARSAYRPSALNRCRSRRDVDPVLQRRASQPASIARDHDQAYEALGMTHRGPGVACRSRDACERRRAWARSGS